jgi:hypothetical protein
VIKNIIMVRKRTQSEAIMNIIMGLNKKTKTKAITNNTVLGRRPKPKKSQTSQLERRLKITYPKKSRQCLPSR